MLLSWVNSADSLKWKQNTRSPILQTEHNKWLRQYLLNPTSQIWIILCGALSVGQVRLERQFDIIYVDIYLSQNSRGRGNASAALNIAIENYYDAYGSKKFHAIVHVENKSSEKMFKKNGFKGLKNSEARK